jgi:uncharacterized membrane protein
VQVAYISTNRELKRLDALSFSPIFHHYSESLAGLTTLRAFRQQAAFEARNQVGGWVGEVGGGGGWVGGWVVVVEGLSA